jgi:predicted ATPase
MGVTTPVGQSVARTNLPLELTSFVGRRAELITVRHLIAESRLVTLTGTGGIGKTRLAVETARQIGGQFSDGVWLVELAPLTNPDLVPNAMLAAFGFGAQPSDAPTESLIRVVAEHKLLCVLDNCEHLLDACARLANALLRSCPQLRILATSREPLGLGGETTWRVPSMATPDTARSLTLQELQGFETMQLFVQRADAAHPGFKLAAENVVAAARICWRLDGIPLAIELAAARIRTLPLGTVDQRLDDRFHLLTGGSRTSLPRQRTLQATLEWSHDLLTGDEQRLFRRLAVFRGGFTLEAAEDICVQGELDVNSAAGVLELLSGLVDKSLVLLEEGTDQAGRFGLLETVREYADQRLRLAGEAFETARRYALYYLALGDAMDAGMRGPEQSAWITRTEDELDNLRACFEWALVQEPRSALRLTLALERYWTIYRRGEGHDWLARSLAAAPERSELRAHALYNASFWAMFQGSFEEARQLGGECLAIARELDSPLYHGQALCVLAMLEMHRRSEGWQTLILPLLQQAEDLVRESANPEKLAYLLNNHGYSLYEAGDRKGARRKLHEAAALALQVGDLALSAAIQGSLADVEFADGARDAAESCWQQELRLSGQVSGFVTASEALAGLGRLALADGQLLRCLRLLGAAVEFFRLTASVLDSPDSDLVNEAREHGQRIIGPERAEAAWREGERMSLAQAVRLGFGEPIEPESMSLVSALASPAADREEMNTFVKEGEFWSIGFAGQLVRLKDSKGLQDLGRLLATPGRELAAVDLATVTSAAQAAPAGRILADLGFGVEADAGPVVDAAARHQYRERLVELEEEITEAETNNDPERASRARDERAFLLAELGAAVGLGGRARPVLDPAEKARKAVTWRIRDAINHIEGAHPELGRHLRRSVRTGTFCVYDPAEAIEWRLSPGTPTTSR